MTVMSVWHVWRCEQCDHVDKEQHAKSVSFRCDTCGIPMTYEGAQRGAPDLRGSGGLSG